MVLHLSTRTPTEYETNLVQLVRNHALRSSQKMVLVDCQSTLTRYLLTNRNYKSLFARVHIVRVHTPPELLTLFQSLHFIESLRHAPFLIISPFYHLISENTVREQKTFLHRVETLLEKLETQLGVHVVIAEG